METINIQGTEEQPNIILDKISNRFEFQGKSLLEDPRAFYKPVLEWIDEYSKSPNDKTCIIYKMDYFNTSSSKLILDMLRKFARMHEDGHEVEIHWYYTEDDEDMLEAGEIYSERTKLPFKLINEDYF